MDAADIAGERQEQALEAALLLQRRSAAGRKAAMEAGLDCMACGEEIPEARRRALPGCCTCVTCQEKIEQGMGR